MNINVTSERAEQQTEEHQFTITSVSGQTISLWIYLCPPPGRDLLWVVCIFTIPGPVVTKNCNQYIALLQTFKDGHGKQNVSPKGLWVVNNESPHCPLYALAFKVDTLNYCVKLRRYGFLLSVGLKVPITDLALHYMSLDHRWGEFKNEGCINQTDPWCSRELGLQSSGQPGSFFSTCSPTILSSSILSLFTRAPPDRLNL